MAKGLFEKCPGHRLPPSSVATGTVAPSLPLDPEAACEDKGHRVLALLALPHSLSPKPSKP
jgi:hypothetical protein